MVSETFNAKTARACDSCIRKRARWYCASDDAFLCQACDALVHTANPLIRGHQRVRLKTASVKQHSLELPSWHSGFTKKPRTPRHGNHHRQTNSDNVRRNPLHLVPEMGPDENWYEENEEQAKLVYRVPIFDPFAAELCLSGNSSEGAINDDKYRMGMLDGSGNCDGNISLHGLYSSDMDLEDFAADVEDLLGKGLDDEESFDMETLGFLHFAEKLDSMELTSSKSAENVKLEEEEMEGSMGNYRIDAEINMNRETFELNFDDCDEYAANYEENYDKAGVGGRGVILKKEECDMGNVKQKEKKKILLALDYEGVIEAWADQKSAWTTGQRLDLDTNDCWPDCMGGCGRMQYYPTYGGMGGSSIGMMLDGSAGREARVSRYREKRRTRLFSKKIRYEVRKLNAEKRPRLKGRFVKPPNFAAA